MTFLRRPKDILKTSVSAGKQFVVTFIDSSSRPEVNLAELTEKHRCQSLFFHKVEGLGPCAVLNIIHSDIGVSL